MKRKITLFIAAAALSGAARVARFTGQPERFTSGEALFMVEALENDELVHEAPAIVGCQTPSALAHAASE
jgi:hypothetical protein